MQEKGDISTQLALKHQQLMNIKMELVKRKLPKNLIHSKSSFKMIKINKTLQKTLYQHTQVISKETQDNKVY